MVFLVMIALIFLRTFIFMWCWNWYVPELFEFPELLPMQAFAINLLWSIPSLNYNAKNEDLDADADEAKEKALYGQVVTAVALVLLLAIGAVGLPLR